LLKGKAKKKRVSEKDEMKRIDKAIDKYEKLFRISNEENKTVKSLFGKLKYFLKSL